MIWGMISPHDSWEQERGRETMAVSFKGAHFPQEIILPCVRWYVAYPPAIPAEPQRPVTNATFQLPVRKHACENSRLT
jgi:hypothetical protein